MQSLQGNGNTSSASAPSSSRWQRLEHQLDEHIRILEAGSVSAQMPVLF